MKTRSNPMRVLRRSCIAFALAHNLDASVQTWTFYAWLVVTSVGASWLLLGLSKFWEGTEGDEVLRRFVMMVAGLAVGVTWVQAAPSNSQVSPRSGSIARSGRSGKSAVSMTRVGGIRDQRRTYHYDERPLRDMLANVTFDVIVTVTAVNDVMTITCIDHVIAVTTVDEVLTLPGIDHIIAGITVNTVMSSVTMNGVIAKAAIHQVALFTAEHGVITGATKNVVIAIAA